jgi:Fungal Zn(2)-Cys(6) binuclear cluster domain/Fungal specific transcription factor domain
MEIPISSPPAQSGPREMSSSWHIQTHSTSLQPAQKKGHRTSTEKVRTGCITCKRRHIKCDEAKPHCSNCLKSRGHCEGYSAGRKNKKPPGPVQVVWDSMQVARASQPRVPIPCLDPDALNFQDDAGMRYFGEFVDLVNAPWTTAATNGDLWAVTLLQLAHGNQTLRHAAIAIGALSKWHSQTKSKSLRAVSVPSLPSVEGDTHYFQAVAYYCRSLKLQNQEASLQGAVFLSVLLLFFEALRGNRKAALDHVNHGLALLLTLTTDPDAHDYVVKFAPNPMPVIGSIADVFTFLAAQARVLLCGRLGQSPPPLSNLMKGLKDKNRTMESFMVLLSQLPRSSPTPDHIPVVFTSLDEFEQFWIPFQRKQAGIGLMMQEVIHTLRESESKDSEMVESFYLEILGNPRINELCKDSRKVMEALDAAFLPLFNKIMMSDTRSPTYLRAIHLRLQHLGLYIFEDPAAFLDMEVLKSRTPLFREYLSLAEIALRTVKRQTKNPAHQLSLQCGLTVLLLSVALHCRDPLVRDQAVWMLKEYPGQDGLWNTRSMYAIALRNRVVEQANAAEGTPAEQLQRLWRREFAFEDCGERALFRYIAKDEAMETWQLVEEAADIQEEAENMDWKRQPLSGSGRPLVFDIYSI